MRSQFLSDSQKAVVASSSTSEQDEDEKWMHGQNEYGSEEDDISSSDSKDEYYDS
jgi:hypothetical protein